jgi:hypothetical protein
LLRFLLNSMDYAGKDMARTWQGHEQHRPDRSADCGPGELRWRPGLTRGLLVLAA